MKVGYDIPKCDKSRFEAIRIVFTNHPKLFRFFFNSNEPKLNYPPDEMLTAAEGFSSGEYCLIKIALDIWCDTGFTRIHDFLYTLDEDNFYSVMLAFTKLRGTNLRFLNYISF